MSTPAEAEREQDEGEEGGSSETELKQKARSFKQGNETSKYKSSSACCSKVEAQRSEPERFVYEWSGGELRLSLLATAIWTASNPLHKTTNTIKRRRKSERVSEWSSQEEKKKRFWQR